MLVDFYHLDASPIERVLPRICERLLADGERLLVVAAPAQLGSLDASLWSYARDSFLPHGLANAEDAATQPILLAERIEAANGARNLALADGEWRDEALGFERVFYLFGAGQLETARASWRALNPRPEVECRYWKQDSNGKWISGP
jgi:DNA polymerase-3 subunit chi